MDRARAEQRVKQVVRRTIGEPYVGKRLKMRQLNRVLPMLAINPTQILDAGAEDATFVYWLADRFPAAQLTAVDIDADAIDSCLHSRPHRYRERVGFRVGSFSDLDADAYDLITAFDVLEHIIDDHQAVADLARALRPGGSLLVHVPRNRWTTWHGVVHEVADDEAWRINPGHVRQGYSPEGLSALLCEAGLKVVRVETWLGRWGVLAHSVYARLERPAPLRVLSIPVTDLCAHLDRGSASNMVGNTVFAHARKPSDPGPDQEMRVGDVIAEGEDLLDT